MHQSRLARTAERQKLAAPVSPLLFPNKQPRPAQQGMNLDQLVPMLIEHGARPGIQIGGHVEQNVVVLQAKVGPITIPLTFFPADAQAIAQAILNSADMLAPPDAQVVEPADPDRDAELLAEATQNVAGDDLGYVIAAEACTDPTPTS